MAVGLGSFFVLGVRALQVNLLDELTTGIGETSPDLILIDVQADQVDGVRAVIAPYLRTPPRITPLMRGRVVEVQGRNGHLRTPEEVRERARLGREFGVTFRSTLEPNESLVSGRFWSGPVDSPLDGVDTEVSVEEEAHDESGLALGDLVRFDFAGGRLLARVTSVRRVEWENTQNGGFVFVFRPAPAVTRLPHSYVGFLQAHDDPAARGALQRDLVQSHPNVSTIDVRAVLASVRDIIDNITLGITVVGSIVLAGGILILVGAVAMTRYQRLYDTAIYRTLGAGGRLVTATAAVEYGLVGALAGVIGSVGAMGLSWVLARFLFEMPWRPAWSLALAGVVVTSALVCVVGLSASAGVLRRKPLLVLRGD
jgi:putative ABC transport system permease protein